MLGAQLVDYWMLVISFEMIKIALCCSSHFNDKDIRFSCLLVWFCFIISINQFICVIIIH